MAHIVIDARESGTSTGRYVDKLVEHLHALKPARTVTVLVKEHRLDFMLRTVPNFAVQTTEYQEFTFGEQLGFTRQLQALRADLVHFPMAQQPVLYYGRTVTTMNDLTTVRFRDPTKNPVVFWAKQQVYKWLVRRVAHKSTRLITYTDFVRHDIAHFAHVKLGKITAIPLAGEPIPEPSKIVTKVGSKQFLLYVGRPTPHKNLARLIDAFVLLQATHPQLYLVLAGKKDKNYAAHAQRVKKDKIRNVIFTDFITDGQLRWLYEHCAAYVFPSLSEGFGLPGLEAMAHGAPVVSSNTTCLPEVYGSAAHYFEPTVIPDIAAKIAEVLDNAALRRQLIAKGRAQVKKYSWDKTARETLAVYEAILASK